MPFILGFRIDGRPIFGFSGGQPDDDGGDGGGNDDDGDDDDGDGDDKPDDRKVGDDGLTEKGRKAIQSERAAANKVRDEFRPIKAAMRAAGIHSVEDLAKRLGGGTGGGGDGKGSGKGDDQVDVEKIRRDIEAQATERINRSAALAKIEARAAKTYADPEDAVNALREDALDYVDKDGKVDVKAIDRDLAVVLERKPHYALKKEGSGTGFDGGARRTATTATGMDDFLRGESAAKRGRR